MGKTPETLSEVCERHGVVLLLQFGSTVSGSDRPDSDLDLAVLLSDPELSFERFGGVHHDLTALEPIARLGQPSFLADPTNEALAERYLERMIGRMIDINYHLITETGNPPPADYYGSFTELGRIGALDPETARRLASSAGLRNRIVQEYDELDPKKIFEAVQASLRDIPEYLRQVNAFTSRSST